MDKPCLLTVTEVAKLLRIQRAKVYILIEDQTLKAFKVGADWRVRVDSLEQLMGPVPQELLKSKQELVSVSVARAS